MILAGADAPLPPSIIAERLLVRRPTLTGVLGTLERRGLVHRLPHATDGRMALIAITPAGEAAIRALRPALHAAERRWLACLTDAEQRQLLQLVARLQANAPASKARRV
jgi:DNA-binding MarR family transcriptional regulator